MEGWKVDHGADLNHFGFIGTPQRIEVGISYQAWAGAASVFVFSIGFLILLRVSAAQRFQRLNR
jgi:multidrug transporter EmrE-like cation transporter